MSVLYVNSTNRNNKKELSSRYSVNEPKISESKSSHNNERHPTTKIQQIFNKTRVNLLLSKEDKLVKYIKEDIESNFVSIKNPNELYNYLLTIHNFRQYIKIYNFDSQTIINSFRLAKYVKLKKNFRLFNQGEKTDFFYLVISGFIGFILNSNSLKSSSPKEVNAIRAGTYFGEWGFIFKINRTVSAYAKEDTLLLKFDKNCFKSFYQENIIHSENISKKFILKHINAFKKLGLTAFNHYYREMKKIYLEQNTQIFQSGDKANYFYIVFSGCCYIKNGFNKLIIKDVGDFIGIESLFKEKYETNIYTLSEETVLFKFAVNIFNSKILEDLRNEFSNYYQNQIKILELWEENYNKYLNKYRLNFNNLIQNIKRNKIKNNKILSEINLGEIVARNKFKKKKKYSSPSKINTNFNSSNFNISKNYNKPETMRIMSPKTSNNNKSLFNDIKNVYIFDKIAKSPSHKMTIKLDLDKKSKDKSQTLKSQTQRLNYMKQKYKLKLKQSHNYSYFMEAMEEILPAYKKINYDNHFSSQNFKIKKRKINSALSKKQCKVNNKKKEKQPINLVSKKNFINEEKFEKAMKLLLYDKYLNKEKKLKKKNINNILKNYKNSSDDINGDAPLIIIRNYSILDD